MEINNAADRNSASVVRRSNNDDTLHVAGVFHTKCYGSDGVLKWEDRSYNLVVNQGKNAMLDTFMAGSGYTAAWYMSLITAGSVTATSTYASPTVTETTSSVIANRLAMTWSAAATGSKAAAVTSFSIIGSATITGNMIVSGQTGVGTVGNTAATGGILFSSAAFSAGSKTVSNGDTLNVSYSISV